MGDYSEQAWTDGSAGGTPLSAARLQHEEDGIYAASIHAFTVYVAASNAGAREKAAAGSAYTCTGTNDHTIIQNAVNAVKAWGGGRVLLSPGKFNFGGSVTIVGTDNPDTSLVIIVQGSGMYNTVINCPSGVSSGFAISMDARVNILDMGFLLDGAAQAISSTASGSTQARSFDNSLFRNLHISGQYSSHTGWALYLGSPFRSLFENLEIEGVKNGIRMFSENASQNPGDCIFQRMMVGLYNPSGAAGTAYSIESPSGMGQMNQVEFVMCEAFQQPSNASGSNGTAFYLGGAAGVTHCKFHGINAEQFDIIWNVDNGYGNHFDANYITCCDGKAGTTAIQFGPNAINNWVKNIGAFYSAVANKLITSTSTDTAHPNLVEHVHVTTGTGTNVTNSISTAGAVIRKWTTSDGAGASGVLVTPA